MSYSCAYCNELIDIVLDWEQVGDAVVCPACSNTNTIEADDLEMDDGDWDSYFWLAKPS